MINRTSAELAANRIATPEPGAVAFMMSKQGYLGDLAGHWHPHLMFFSGYTDVADWGANLHGSPVFSARDDSQRLTTFYVLVPAWSDGTSTWSRRCTRRGFGGHAAQARRRRMSE